MNLNPYGASQLPPASGLHDRLQATTVYVTHDQLEAMAMADTIAIMNQGVIEQLGSPTELYENPATTFVANFLGQSNLIGGSVVGVEGDAPYWLDIEAMAFLSDKGELTARIEASYDLRITQKLILRPSTEIDFSAQDMPDIRVGSGLSTVEAGVRLRYEIVPEFAPYLGFEWHRKLGQTADYARADGHEPGSSQLVAGVRFWF